MEAAESFEDNKSEGDQNRGTQRENFTIGVGTPFYVISVFSVRLKALFLNAKKSVSFRIR